MSKLLSASIREDLRDAKREHYNIKRNGIFIRDVFMQETDFLALYVVDLYV